MGNLVLLWEEKKTSMYFGGLFMTYEIDYGFQKENTKFKELNSFYCVQLLFYEKITFIELVSEI